MEEVLGGGDLGNIDIVTVSRIPKGGLVLQSQGPAPQMLPDWFHTWTCGFRGLGRVQTISLWLVCLHGHSGESGHTCVSISLTEQLKLRTLEEIGWFGISQRSAQQVQIGARPTTE